ncbi:MAG: hypothetical protein J7521_02040 [Caulobacter sp.]|nr:hypothetical protein [Caulobacter sp.]
METVGTEASAFGRSNVFMEMYGSEARFDALVSEEAQALTTPEGIFKFLQAKLTELGRDGGGRALRWVSAELLKALGLGGGPSDLEQIRTMLDKVLQQQALILKQLETLLEEVKFQHLITRSFDAVEQIISVHEDLQNLSRVLGQPERDREAARLRAGILDVRGGAMRNLRTIHNVLIGADTVGQSDPLIRLFTGRWLPVFLPRQLLPDVPLSTYSRRLDDWLHGLFIIQYMGLAQIANARIANGDFELLKLETETVIANMAAQRALLNEAVPAWTRTLPTSVLDGRWYVVRGHYLNRGRVDNSQVLYGSPAARTGYILNLTVQFRDRNFRNGDEEWLFEKSGPNDAFTMRQRARAHFIGMEGGVRMRPSGRPLRLVMGPRRGPPAGGADAYVPVLGFVGGGDEYLCWTRGGSNVVGVGPIDRAVPVEIVPA